LTIDQTFSWDDDAQMSDDVRPTGAYYTMREWRPATKELDMLFMLHGDEGDASAWAATATHGDRVALWGPREAFTPPADPEWYLLVADDTGLPAVAAILDSLAQDTVVRVFAEVDCEAEQQALASRPSLEVTWLYRRGAEPGSTTLLVDAVRAMPWPGGAPYVWGGGESHQMTAVRRYVRDECGVPSEAASLVAYWRSSGQAPVDDD
jgi:NADPH-dependent ferric siderophore reductase